MAGETGRIIKRKRVELPGGSTVDIPVIYQITFQDVPERGHETQYTIDNTHTGDRDIRVALIYGNGDPTDESGDNLNSYDSSFALKVQRVDLWRVLDAPSRGQETFFSPDSKTVAQPPDAPPYFTTHTKTHIVKYLNTPDDGSWIKSELIDEITFVDVPERGQESHHYLLNPPDNTDIDGLVINTDDSEIDDDGNPIPITTIAISQEIEDITDSSEGEGSESDIDPPWRTDPFQNIVDFQDAGIFHFLEFTDGLTTYDDNAIYGGPPQLWWSENGKDWTQADVPAFSLAKARVEDFEYLNGQYMIKSNYVGGQFVAFFMQPPGAPPPPEGGGALVPASDTETIAYYLGIGWSITKVEHIDEAASVVSNSFDGKTFETRFKGNVDGESNVTVFTEEERNRFTIWHFATGDQPEHFDYLHCKMPLVYPPDHPGETAFAASTFFGNSISFDGLISGGQYTKAISLGIAPDVIAHNAMPNNITIARMQVDDSGTIGNFQISRNTLTQTIADSAPSFDAATYTVTKTLTSDIGLGAWLTHVTTKKYTDNPAPEDNTAYGTPF